MPPDRPNKRPHGKQPQASASTPSPDHISDTAPVTGGEDDADDIASFKQKRNRVITKCDRCRRRKQKCNSLLPCSTCLANEVDCLYSDGKPIANYEAPITTSSREIAFIREGISQIQAALPTLLAHQPVATPGPTQWNGETGSIAGALPAPPILERGLDLEKDDVAEQISCLWLRPQTVNVDSMHQISGTSQENSLYTYVKSCIATLDTAGGNHQPGSGSRSSLTPRRHLESDSSSCVSSTDWDSLPSESELRRLCNIYMQHQNWFFELYNPQMIFDAEQSTLKLIRDPHLSSTNLTLQEWTHVAQTLAICRMSIMVDASSHSGSTPTQNVSNDERSMEEAKEQSAAWMHLALTALREAKHTLGNPTVGNIKAAVTVLSAIFFEIESGETFLGFPLPGYEWLRYATVHSAYELSLHREPGNHFGPDEADERRRLWWSLVCIDAQLTTSSGRLHSIIQLETSDTVIPRSPSRFNPGSVLFTSCNLDLLSSETRFLIGRFHNLISRLTIQRSPAPKESDVARLDNELVAWEKRIDESHQLVFRDGKFYDMSQHRTTHTLPRHRNLVGQIPAGSSAELELRKAQTSTYISVYHLRARLHRPLHTPQAANREGCNVDWHRDVVVKCGKKMLKLWERGGLTLIDTSSVAQAVVSLLIDVYPRPNPNEAQEIVPAVKPFVEDLAKATSPTMMKATSVLESLYECILKYPIYRSLFDSTKFKSSGVNGTKSTLQSDNSDRGVEASAWMYSGISVPNSGNYSNNNQWSTQPQTTQPTFDWSNTSTTNSTLSPLADLDSILNGSLTGLPDHYSLSPSLFGRPPMFTTQYASSSGMPIPTHSLGAQSVHGTQLGLVSRVPLPTLMSPSSQHFTSPNVSRAAAAAGGGGGGGSRGFADDDAAFANALGYALRRNHGNPTTATSSTPPPPPQQQQQGSSSSSMTRTNRLYV